MCISGDMAQESLFWGCACIFIRNSKSASTWCSFMVTWRKTSAGCREKNSENISRELSGGQLPNLVNLVCTNFTVFNGPFTFSIFSHLLNPFPDPASSDLKALLQNLTMKQLPSFFLLPLFSPDVSPVTSRRQLCRRRVRHSALHQKAPHHQHQEDSKKRIRDN